MARASRRPMTDTVADQVLDPPESTLLDLLDNLLNKGVMANGDVTLGVAGIDLIYLRLSALLCAADRVAATGRAGRRAAPPPPPRQTADAQEARVKNKPAPRTRAAPRPPEKIERRSPPRR